MSLDPLAAATILGMAAITFLTRAGGFWMMRLITPSGRLEQWLKYVPGAVIVSLVVPNLIEAGLVEIAGFAVVVLVARMVGQDLAAMAAGVAAVALIRHAVGA